jgi:hypothetical protein
VTVLINRDVVREPLYVIVPVYNPWRWTSRYKHTTRAIKHFVESGAVVILVEAAFNRREFVFADSGLDGTPANCGIIGSDPKFRHRYIPLRTRSELWIKENMVNVAAGMTLPYDWQQMAWLDSDVTFVRPNWVGETIQKLQHYSFVQMFSHARDLSPNYEVMPQDYPHADGVGFVHHHSAAQTFDVTGTVTTTSDQETAQLQTINIALKPKGVVYQEPGPPRLWPGLAWAGTREAWDSVGGLLDFAIWGGGDWHMAHALMENPRDDQMMRGDLHPNYQAMVRNWRELCQKHVRRNVGVVTGSVFHNFHGRKWDRGYNQKHLLLAQFGFDPQRHLKRDYQGIYQLHDDGSEAYVKLRDESRRIAMSRDEDTTDTREELWRAWKDNH